MSNEKENRILAFAAWFATLLLFCYQAIARSSFPTVLNERFMEHFGLDAAGVGALTSCYYWVYAFMQIPAGIIIDKFSARIIATASAATCACGIFLFISTSNYYVAGLGQALLGLGASFALLLSLKVIATWFPANEVPIKMAYTFAITGLGPIIGGPVVSALVKTFSWMDVIRVYVAFGLLCAAVIWFVLRDKKSSVDPEQKSVSTMTSLKTILSSRQAWLLAALTIMQYSPICALGDMWGASFIKKACGVDPAVAALINNTIYVGIIIGAPTFARLALRLNSYKKPTILGISLSTICVGALVFCGNLSIEAVFCLFLLIGFCCGAMLSIFIVMATFPRSAEATAAGFMNMSSMLGGVILMPLIGYIADLSWSGAVENGVRVYEAIDFRWGLASVFAFLAIGTLLSLIIRDVSPKESGRRRYTGIT